MNDLVLVQPTGPMGWMPPETVESLIEDLRAEGLDARISYDEIPGGMEPWEVVFSTDTSTAGLGWRWRRS